MVTGLSEEEAIEIMNRGRIVDEMPLKRATRVVFKYRGKRLSLIKRLELGDAVSVGQQAKTLYYFKDNEGIRIPEVVIASTDPRLKIKPQDEDFGRRWDYIFTFDLTEEGRFRIVENSGEFFGFRNYLELQEEMMRTLALIHGNGYHHVANILDYFIWKEVKAQTGLQYFSDASHLCSGHATREDFLPTSLDEVMRLSTNLFTQRPQLSAIRSYGSNEGERNYMITVYNNTLEQVLAKKPVAEK